MISCAEVLHEHQRKKIEKVFACHVLNSYGGMEVSSIAMECPKHNGLHVLMENQIVELLDSNEFLIQDSFQEYVLIFFFMSGASESMK